MKKYKKRYKSIEQINDNFSTNYLFEKRYFSIDTHKSQKIRRKDQNRFENTFQQKYYESSRRADHEYLVSFDVTAAVEALLSKDFDKATYIKLACL
jgi:hypothetical protein